MKAVCVCAYTQKSKTTCASWYIRSCEVTFTIKPICFQSGRTSCAKIPLLFQQQALIIVLPLSSKNASITLPHSLVSKVQGFHRRFCQMIPFCLCTLFAIKKNIKWEPTCCFQAFSLCLNMWACECIHLCMCTAGVPSKHIINWLVMVWLISVQNKANQGCLRQLVQISVNGRVAHPSPLEHLEL